MVKSCIAEGDVSYYIMYLIGYHLEVSGDCPACRRVLELLGTVIKSSSRTAEMEDGAEEKNTAHHA